MGRPTGTDTGTGAGPHRRSFGNDSMRLAAENGKLVCVLPIRRRRSEDVVRDARCDPAIGLKEDLLGFHLKTLDDGLKLRNHKIRFQGCGSDVVKRTYKEFDGSTTIRGCFFE